MGFTKLNLPPDQAGYAVTDGNEVISTQLDGGASRYRKDVVGAYARVNVQWRINPIEFRYLKTFYNLLIGKGSQGFLLDLYLDREELTEHECHFVPGSFRLSGQQGKQFTVSAQLEAKPIRLSDAEEAEQINWATLFGELGEDFETLFPPIEADVDQTITFDLPNVFGLSPASVEEIIQALDGYEDGAFIDTVGTLALPVAGYVNCLEFDAASTQWTDLGYAFQSIHRTGVFDFSFWMYLDATGTQRIMGSNLASAAYGTAFDVLTGKLRVIIGAGTSGTYALIHDGITVQTGWHKYRYYSTDGVTAYGTIDDGTPVSEAFNFTPNNTEPSSATFRLGRIATETSYFTGKLALIKDTDYFPLEEGNGLPQEANGTGLGEALSNTATWSTGDFEESHDLEYGHTPSVFMAKNSAYSDTAIVPENDPDFYYEVTGYFTDVASSSLMGARGDGVAITPYFYFGTNAGSGKFALVYGAGSVISSLDSDTNIHTHRVYGDGRYFIDGTLVATGTGSIAGLTSSIFLNGVNSNGTLSNSNEDFVCLSASIRNSSGVLVRDLVPLPNGRFLDKVNNEVYWNDGTGTLVTQYDPALTEKTKSVATFDGVADFINCNNKKVIGGTAISFAANYKVLRVTNNGLFGCGGFSGPTKGVFLRQANAATFICGSSTGVSGITSSFTVPAISVGDDVDLLFEWDGEASYPTLTINGTVYIGDAQLVPWTGDSTQYLTVCAYNQGITQEANIALRTSSLVGFFDYDLTTYNGKTTDTITDLSGNGNDGTASTGAGGLDSFWGVWEANEDGIIRDAKHALPIAVGGGYVHNGCEVSITQESYDIPANIGVSGTGITQTDVICPLDTPLNGKQSWVNYDDGTVGIYWDSGYWHVDNASSVWRVKSNSPLPKTTGYTLYSGPGGTGNPVLAFPEGFSFLWKDFEDLLSHPNGENNLWLKFEQVGGRWAVKKYHQYRFDKVFTSSEHNKNSVYYGETPLGGINPYV